MPYSEKDYKSTNINYLNKDFSSLKNNLMEYAKTYFPNSYKDFNETSPGMMLIEMSAYVGDVLSFYIDQQYKEMMLPLAEERRNVANIAKMLGYKTKAVKPAYTILTITQDVDIATIEDGTRVPDYNSISTATKRLEPRTQVKSSTNPDMIFETLEYVDFTFSGSANSSYLEPEPSEFDSSTGLVTKFSVKRKVKAISGDSTKTKVFNINTPQKFLKLTLPETDVIEIIQVLDSNSNEWKEVDYLAQELVPKEIFYADTERIVAYGLEGAGDEETTSLDTGSAVPYALQFEKTSKKFTTTVNDDNTTSLIFGNGILRSGQTLGTQFIQSEQAGITIPGDEGEFSGQIDPLSGDNEATLGEAPGNTNLTVTYRTGGGLDSNVGVGDLTTFVDSTIDAACSVTNEVPAEGGSTGETIEEIRQKGLANFTSQLRCVTKHDYEARVLSMPAKFGGVAKVFVRKNEAFPTDLSGQASTYTGEQLFFTAGGDSINPNNTDLSTVTIPEQTVESIVTPDDINSLKDLIDNYLFGGPEGNSDMGGLYDLLEDTTDGTIDNTSWVEAGFNINASDEPPLVTATDFDVMQNTIHDAIDNLGITQTITPQTLNDIAIYTPSTYIQETSLPEYTPGVSNVEIFIMGYNDNKNLIRFHEGTLGEDGNIDPSSNRSLIFSNIANYLEQYKIMTDKIIIKNGYIINFGVVFDVVAHKSANKADVKLACIQKIINYFDIDRMQFRQALYPGELEYELMGLDGVRAVNYITLTQDIDYNNGDEVVFDDGTGSGLWYWELKEANNLSAGIQADASINPNSTQYNFRYNFKNAFQSEDGIILPSLTPSIFELKNPNENVKGVVR